MRKFKHIKVRNTGLLFECLLRQVTSDVLRKDEDSNAVRILKQKFNENTELGKELALYNILVNKKFKDDKKAEYFINEVVKARHKLNNSVLKRERYNLIKELKENYNIDKLFKTKINDYKAQASLHTLFELVNTEKAIDPNQIIDNKVTLLEHLTKKEVNKENIKKLDN